ncbi:MAG TPA: hypothetical protein PK668_06385 [Myxococcota bacterium]|nr:hypothetical protein [Myxococcota bacterium]HRY92530.1 hypothetical protein [Myxococcota bacterium]HSA22064.1 hypothetical protein [Myxococcota bacterium]
MRTSPTARGGARRAWLAAGLGLALASAGCQRVLQSGLEEQEANEILAALEQAGLSGDKAAGGAREGYRVEVAGAELGEAWQALRAAGLPRPRHAGFREVFKERGLVPGATEEAALYLGALQEELARTLEALEGVCAARVHVVAPRTEPGLLARGAPPAAPSAAVLLTVSGGGVPISTDEVRALVAHAVEGLEPGRVAVVLAPRPAARRGTGALAPEGGAWRLLAAAVGGLALLGGAGLAGWRWLRTWRGARAEAGGAGVAP